MPVLKLAVPQLLAGKTVEAAQTLDHARLLLQSAEPSAAERWAAALLVHPATRLIDPADGPLVLRILPAYPTSVPPRGMICRFAFVTADGTSRPAADTPVKMLPLETSFPIDKLPAGDCTLHVDIVGGGKSLATYAVGISIVPNLRARYNSLRPNGRANAGPGLDAATLRAHIALLGYLMAGGSPEVNFPADRLFDESQGLANAIAKKGEFYGPQRQGQFWLNVPTGQNTTPVRLFVPKAAAAGKPMPLVVALHGAGGSENLFFDAYGYGLIARLAQERGWMVVAPRAGWLFDGPPAVPTIVDELAKIYPIDPKRVFLVGHSMGAMQAVTLAQQSPGRYAAIAVLGGGGTITKPEAFKKLPVFIGCGREDFLLGGATGLAKSLEKAGAMRVTFKEFPNVEHMLVVQEALPDVFKFFAAASH